MIAAILCYIVVSLIKAMNRGTKLFYRQISNPAETPWLDWIESGIKTYEGRLNKEIWSKLRVGDHIVFQTVDETKEVEIIVTELRYYKDFGEAFNELGSKLVPIKDANVDDVKKLYNQFFTDDDVAKYGVVAVGIRPLLPR